MTQTHWDHYFGQWMAHWLPQFHLRVELKPLFAQLPLEADILVTTPHYGDYKPWLEHPLWRYLSAWNVIEFKSIHDVSRPYTLETLSAYVALAYRKFQLPSGSDLAGWLIVPAIKGAIKASLEPYPLNLQEISPGFWQGHTALFPLCVVEYEHLPNIPEHFDLKTFMATGQELKTALLNGLERLKDSPLYEEYITIISAIHTQEAEQVIEIKESERANIAHVINHLLQKSPELGREIAFIQQQQHESERRGEQKGKLEGKLESRLETARQMKLKGFAGDLIAELTGLTLAEIESLK